MKRFLIIALMLIAFPLTAAIAPTSQRLGPVAIDVKKGSLSELAKEAFNDYFSPEWLEKYSINDDLFALTYSSTLASILPMDNLIFGKEGKNSLSFYSQDTMIEISLVFSEGKISAMDVRIPKSQTDQEET